MWDFVCTPTITTPKKQHMFIVYEDLLDLGLISFVGQGLRLKMELEENKLKLSAYKMTMKSRTQILMTGNFALGGFIIIPEVILMMGVRELKLKCWKKKFQYIPFGGNCS